MKSSGEEDGHGHGHGQKDELTLRSIHDSLDLLITESIPKVQAFRPKWSLIAAKLTTLQNLLSQVFDIPVQKSSSLSADVLRSISSTLSSAESLAADCSLAAPPSGKLMTQNHVHSLYAALDGRIHDLEVIRRSGDENGTTVLPGRRESVRAEARNLITRLQIGSNESKNSTLEMLLGLLQEDDRNVMISVSQGIIPVLLRLLDSTSSTEVKEKTVAAIARISTAHSSKNVLLTEGLVLLSNMLRVLESGSIFAKEKSCIVLTVLSSSKENARAIASRGGVAALLDICQEGTPNSQALAAGVLRNLALFEEIRESFLEENAVQTLLGLCDLGTALAQENSIGCLCNLVCDDDHLKLLVAREGGLECVKTLWDSSSDVRSLEVAVRMVRTLATCPHIAEFLVENGFLTRVFGALNSSVPNVMIEAAHSLCDFAYCNKVRKELGEMGCVSLLVRMLDGKAIEEKEAAVKALSVLMEYAGNRRLFRKEDKGIVYVVQILDPLVKVSDKTYVVAVLGSLVHSKKCRKQMANSGACVYLPKLVEANVDGAKKLLDSIGHGGKLWGVFARH